MAHKKVPAKKSMFSKVKGGGAGKTYKGSFKVKGLGSHKGKFTVKGLGKKKK